MHLPEFLRCRLIWFSQPYVLNLCQRIMVRIKTLIIISLLVNSTGLAQTVRFTCVVLDSESKKPIPYVSLGVREKGIGTNADQNGRISFMLNSGQLSDSAVWVFSSIAHEPREICQSDFSTLNGDTVILKPTTVLLKEVGIKSTGLKRREIGKKSHGALTHINLYSVRDSIDDGLSQEFGVLLNLRSACLIRDFNVFFSSNNFDSLRFQFFLYEMDNDELTRVPLPGPAYLVVTDYEWQRLQLDEIELPKGQYAFTLQLIDQQFSGEEPRLSMPMTVPSPFNGFIYRSKSQDEWDFRKSANPSMFLTADCE